LRGAGVSLINISPIDISKENTSPVKLKELPWQLRNDSYKTEIYFG
jgi:hypothetical protein